MASEGFCQSGKMKTLVFAARLIWLPKAGRSLEKMLPSISRIPKGLYSLGHCEVEVNWPLNIVLHFIFDILWMDPQKKQHKNEPT